MSLRRRRARGFTLIEAAVVVAIMGILLAIGLPSMSNWLLARKAMAAAVSYQDGLLMARNAALAHNSHSRLVLTDNTSNGKKDWRVDICFVVDSTPCDDANGNWSTVDAPAANDPDTHADAAKFHSVQRLADGMPGDGDLALAVGPDDAGAVYFTQLGWVDASIASHLQRIDLAPSSARANAFTPISVVVPLAGGAVICNTNAPAGDARRCPPQ